MFDRNFFDSQLGKAALVSVTAMVILNVVALASGGAPSLGIAGNVDLAIPSMMASLA